MILLRTWFPQSAWSAPPANQTQEKTPQKPATTDTAAASGADGSEQATALATYLQQKTIVVRPQPQTDQCIGRLVLPSEYSRYAGAPVTVLAVRDADAKKVDVPAVAAVLRPQTQAAKNAELELTLTFDPATIGRDGKYLVDLEFLVDDSAALGDAGTSRNPEVTLTCQVPSAQFDPVAPILVEQTSWFMGFKVCPARIWQDPRVTLREPPEELTVLAEASAASSADKQPGPGAIRFWGASKQSHKLKPNESTAIDASISQPFRLGTHTGTLRLRSAYGGLEVPYTVFAHEGSLMVPFWILLGVGVAYLLRRLIPQVRARINVEQATERLITDLGQAAAHREDDEFMETLQQLRNQGVQLDVSAAPVDKSWEQARIDRLNELRGQMDAHVTKFEQRRQAASIRLKALADVIAGLRVFEKPLGLEIEGKLDKEKDQLTRGLLTTLESRLHEIEEELEADVRSKFKKRHRTMLTNLFKRDLPDLGFHCPADVKQRFSQGVDAIIEAGKNLPADASELKAWVAAVRGLQETALAIATRLVSDTRSKVTAAISRLRSIDGFGAGSELDEAERSLKPLDDPNIDALIQGPLTAAAIDQALWMPLRSTLEIVWAVIVGDFNAIIKQALDRVSSDDSGKAQREDLARLKKEFREQVASGDIDAAVRMLISARLEYASALEADHGETTHGGPGAIDAVTQMLTAVPGMLPPLSGSPRRVSGAESAEPAVDTRFAWSPGRWDLAQKRKALGGFENILLAVVATAVGTFLFLPDFVGGFKDIAALVVWGFGLDLSVNGVLAHARSAR